MFSLCFYSMSSCRWVIHQSVTPKAFVSPSSSTKTSFHPSLSDSLLSFSFCHLSCPNFIRVCFLAVQHPSNTSGPFHYISPARNELRSGKVQSTWCQCLFASRNFFLIQIPTSPYIIHQISKRGSLAPSAPFSSLTVPQHYCLACTFCTSTTRGWLLMHCKWARAPCDWKSVMLVSTVKHWSSEACSSKRNTNECLKVQDHFVLGITSEINTRQKQVKTGGNTLFHSALVTRYM